MTPKVVELMQRLANGEEIYCPHHEEPILGIYLRVDRRGRLEFKNEKTYSPDVWHDAGTFGVNSLLDFAARAVPSKPEQPQRRVRSVDLSK